MRLTHAGLFAAAGAFVVFAVSNCGGEGGGDTTCTVDADCSTQEICHRAAGVCVKTCSAATECPDSAKDCGPNTDTRASADAGTQKICRCSTDALCNGGSTGELVCSAAYKVCTAKCTSNADCAGGTCNTTTGQCAAGYKLETGLYVASAATSLNDGCQIDPNNASDPLAGDEFLVTNTSGAVSLGASDGGLTGTPPQPSQGQGTLSGNTATLIRDNKVTSGTCTFRREVTNAITLTADNKFSSKFTRRDSEHATDGGCVSVTACTSTWDWSLTKK